MVHIVSWIFSANCLLSELFIPLIVLITAKFEKEFKNINNKWLKCFQGIMKLIQIYFSLSIVWKEVNFSRGFKKSRTLTNKVSCQNRTFKLHYFVTNVLLACFLFSFSCLFYFLVSYSKMKISLNRITLLVCLRLFYSVLWDSLMKFVLCLTECKIQTTEKDSSFSLKVFCWFMLQWIVFFKL